jgi:hypothetical protein
MEGHNGNGHDTAATDGVLFDCRINETDPSANRGATA